MKQKNIKGWRKRYVSNNIYFQDSSQSSASAVPEDYDFSEYQVQWVKSKPGVKAKRKRDFFSFLVLDSLRT